MIKRSEIFRGIMVLHFQEILFIGITHTGHVFRIMKPIAETGLLAICRLPIKSQAGLMLMVALLLIHTVNFRKKEEPLAVWLLPLDLTERLQVMLRQVI